MLALALGSPWDQSLRNNHPRCTSHSSIQTFPRVRAALCPVLQRACGNGTVLVHRVGGAQFRVSALGCRRAECSARHSLASRCAWRGWCGESQGWADPPPRGKQSITCAGSRSAPDHSQSLPIRPSLPIPPHPRPIPHPHPSPSPSPSPPHLTCTHGVRASRVGHVCACAFGCIRRLRRTSRWRRCMASWSGRTRRLRRPHPSAIPKRPRRSCSTRLPARPLVTERRSRAAHLAALETGRRPHLDRDWAHPFYICTGIGLIRQWPF